MANKGKINWRSFVSVYMAYSLIMMGVTGIVLYIAPPGRIAHWSKWTFLGFTKTEWQALHTLFSFIWIIAAVYHLIFNWKPLMNYIRRKTAGAKKIRKEFTYATLATAIVFFGTYYNIPPFGTVMDLGEYITDSWADETNEPPIPHAELQTLGEFSRTVHIPINKVVQTLRANKINVPDTSIVLEDLAAQNGITPSKIYLLLKVNKSLPDVKKNTKYGPGSGIGRKTLSEILKENDIAWEKGVEMLKKKGITVTEDDKLKNIAEENNVSPIEIIDALGLR
jgi:hypothetical protein